jgi:glycosyltransferase involved in cell wall biosynthesis
MRVVLVNRLAGIHRGGGEIYDLSLVEALRSAGVEASMITGRPLLAPPPMPVTECPAIYVRSPYLRATAFRMGRAGWRLFDADLRRFERGAESALVSMSPPPDLVQVTGLPDLALRLQEIRRIRTVLLFPGPPSERHRPSILACRHVVGVGAVTPYLRKTFREDVHDMTAGVDLDLFRPGSSDVRTQWRIDARTPLLLFAGRLVPLKNVPLLIEAFAEIRRQIPAARLLVAGDGPMRSEMRLAAAGARLPDEALVHAGEVPHREMPRYYAASDLLLLTSLEESFSLVALEAMACGLSVLVPAAGYLPRLVVDGESGTLYPPGDRVALVRSAVALLRDPERRRAIGDAARREAERRHSWSSVAAEFRSLYEQVLAG